MLCSGSHRPCHLWLTKTTQDSRATAAGLAYLSMIRHSAERLTLLACYRIMATRGCTHPTSPCTTLFLFPHLAAAHHHYLARCCMRVCCSSVASGDNIAAGACDRRHRRRACRRSGQQGSSARKVLECFPDASLPSPFCSYVDAPQKQGRQGVGGILLGIQ